MTLLNPNYFPKAPPPDTIALRYTVLMCEFGKDTNIHVLITSEAKPRFLTRRNYKIMNMCYLKPLHFGLICKAVTDN